MNDIPDSKTYDIFCILTNKRFRAGPLPPEKVKEKILLKINEKVRNDLPIKLFQFWGSCKNPNLLENDVDICEEATLNNLFCLAEEVKKVYSPGLKICISPGDGRVEGVNNIPHEKTALYVKGLERIASQEKYKNLFTIVTVSSLYNKYHIEFNNKINGVRKRISEDIEKQPGFEKLVANAGKNIFITTENQDNKDIKKQSIKSAKEYVIYRVAEEEVQIFRDFDDCIRSFFIKYIPFYKQFIADINLTKPDLECSLVLYTGGKGNVSQPWQSVGIIENNKVKFLGQTKIMSL